LREEIIRWHSDVVAEYTRNMFDTLLYPEQITTSSMKEFELEPLKVDEDGILAKGYFATKDKKKYFVHADHYPYMPLRLKPDILKEYRFGSQGKQDVIYTINKPIPFKVLPDHTMEFDYVVDNFLDFESSNPKHWIMLKVMAIMLQLGKGFVCLSSNPSLGKTSIFSMVHGLTNKCPVFKPRSVPGVLNKINTDGNMVFDEAHQCKKEVRDIMEEFSLDIAGGKSMYVNGAQKSANTKNNYNCFNQSITYLYNNAECYKQPDKVYFDVNFKNNEAMDDRFLKFKLQGELTEKFSRDFDIIGAAKQYESVYRKYLKEFAWLQQQLMSGKLKRRYEDNYVPTLKIRKKQTWDLLTLGFDMYAKTQGEYDEWCLILIKCKEEYEDMVLHLRNELKVDNGKSVDDDVKQETIQ